MPFGRRIRVVGLVTAVAVAMTLPAASQPAPHGVPRAQAGVSLGVFNFGDVSQRPVCVDLAVACAASNDTSDTSALGGGLWLNVGITAHVAVAAEASGYGHPWAAADASEEARASPGDNRVWFFLAGPRFIGPARTLGRRVIGPPSRGPALWRAYGQVLLGAATSDKGPSGTTTLLAGGLEVLDPCRSTMTCVFGGEAGYRKVAAAGHLSGLRVLLRVGFGF
jgi:hypothetical protein